MLARAVGSGGAERRRQPTARALDAIFQSISTKKYEKHCLETDYNDTSYTNGHAA